MPLKHTLTVHERHLCWADFKMSQSDYEDDDEWKPPSAAEQKVIGDDFCSDLLLFYFGAS